MIIYYETNLQLFYRQLENELEQRTAELESTRDALRHKEEEAEEYKSQQNYMVEQVSLANQKVEDSWATIRQQEAELARLREVLRRTEKELDERVAHLEQRYLFSEEERSMYTKILLEFFFAKKMHWRECNACTVLDFRQDAGAGTEESGGVENRAACA